MKYFQEIHDNFPELPAYLVEGKNERVWKVWCEPCGKWHTHGAGPANGDPMEFLGHRIGHCANADRGYILIYGGRWTELTPGQQRYGLKGNNPK